MRKKWASRLLAMMLTGVTVVSMMPANIAHAEEADGQHLPVGLCGEQNSANDGTSEKKAFKTLDKINEITLGPGDKVLLEKGSVFTDQYLHVQGSGSAEAPIEISTYGEGNRPRIDANGTGVWYQDYGNHLDNTGHKWKGNVSSTILLKDVEYIEIRGLELTNDRETSKVDDGLKYNDANVMDRTGVAGVAKDKGTVDHIVLDDLYVHDVDGNVINKHMANGGIYFIVEKPTDENATGASKFNDLTIENCSVVTTNRWGIAAAYTYAWAQLNSAHLNEAALEKYASSNVTIQNNYIKAAGGDAITTMYESEFRMKAWELPVSDLLYVGRSTNKKLESLGIRTIGGLAQMDEKILQSRLGKMGAVLWAFANGYDDSPVKRENTSAPIKSIGNSTTTPKELETDEDVKIMLYILSESVAVRLRENGFRCRTVEISIRDNELYSFTRQCKLDNASNITGEIASMAYRLFKANYRWDKPIRSVGVRGADLVNDNYMEQLDLFCDFQMREKQMKMDVAVDDIRRRFGFYSIQRGLMYRDRALSAVNAKEDHTVHPHGYFG